MSIREPEPAAKALADILPVLTHPKTGSTLMFAGMGSTSMAPMRLETAEAVLHFLRENGHMPKALP